MKKSIIAVSLATVFSLPAIADVDVQNPIWNEQPSNPIEQVPTQPQQTWIQPILPVPTNPIKAFLLNLIWITALKDHNRKYQPTQFRAYHLNLILTIVHHGSQPVDYGDTSRYLRPN